MEWEDEEKETRDELSHGVRHFCESKKRLGYERFGEGKKASVIWLWER